MIYKYNSHHHARKGAVALLLHLDVREGGPDMLEDVDVED
jgi:hypothetical protein